MAPTPRKRLQHFTPAWVDENAVYYVTICCLPRDANQLCNPETSSVIRNTIVHREQLGQWWVSWLVLMPDHLHMLVSIGRRFLLPHVITAWKRYVARHSTVRWQDGFFDHRIRSEQSVVEKTEYMRFNPVRAGLIERAEDWPYSWGH